MIDLTVVDAARFMSLFPHVANVTYMLVYEAVNRYVVWGGGVSAVPSLPFLLFLPFLPFPRLKGVTQIQLLEGIRGALLASATGQNDICSYQTHSMRSQINTPKMRLRRMPAVVLFLLDEI